MDTLRACAITHYTHVCWVQAYSDKTKMNQKFIWEAAASIICKGYECYVAVVLWGHGAPQNSILDCELIGIQTI